MENNFYITTTLPYVNADPHIGFALEIIQADAIARYQRLLGKEVFFNTGTDDHGLKIFLASQKNNKSPKEFCDQYAVRFNELKDALGLSYNNFIRTTDEDHIKAAQFFWRRSFDNGDIYKAKYKAKYCVGCELEKTDSELADGKCLLHPNLAIELIEEENYFFRWSRYQDKLLELYEKNSEFVVPEERFNEIKNFVKNGLQDFSISRLKNKMPWGIEVPDDPDHVMYVWFDALINYIAAIGWPDNLEQFNKWWPGFQVAGKDNLRQQSAMWQAMLMSCGLSLSKQILIHGFVTANGQKMSKSLGNVVSPIELAAKYGTDAVRYYLLSEIPTMKDGDFTIEKFEARYNGDLANGLGNLISRIMTMALNDKLRKGIRNAKLAYENKFDINKHWENYFDMMSKFLLNEALGGVNNLIKKCDRHIAANKPWELIKNDYIEEAEKIIFPILETLRHIAWMLSPFIPETSEKIFKALGILYSEKKKTLQEAKEWGNVKFDNLNKGEALFPRVV